MLFRDYKKEEVLFFKRAIMSFLIVAAGFAALVVNLYHLQIDDYNEYKLRSADNYIRLIPIEPVRGIIYDRNGIPLVENVKSYDLDIMPYKVDHLKATVSGVLSDIGDSQDDINEKLKEISVASKFKYFTLKEGLSDVEIAKFSVDEFKYPGVSISTSRYRHYIYGADLAHVIGFVSKINASDLKRIDKEGQSENYLADKDIGKQGIEAYYENALHGQTGFKEVEVDNHGRVVRVIKETPAIAGENIHLTIDLKLQQYIEKLLVGQNAAMIVEDPRDGSVLAMVSNPSYDPNPFVKGISYKDYKALLNDPNRPLINRVTQGLYPPASTVKPYIAFSAMYKNIIKPTTTLYSGPSWTLPGTKRSYRDWVKTGHGTINFKQAIEESADTFFYQVAYMMGIDTLHEMLSKFGYGKMSGIDLNEQYAGLLPSREWKMKVHKQPWYQGDTVPVGIGQGYWLASPIQMEKAMVTLINNGKALNPHLMMNEQFGNVVVPYSGNDKVGYIADKNSPYWGLVQDAMFGMANSKNGTGYRFFHTAPYGIASKTGTSQVFSLKEHQIYNAKNIPLRLHDHIFYTAYAPYKSPTVAIVLILENGGVNGIMGAKVIRNVMDHMLLPADEQSMPYIYGGHVGDIL